VRGVGDESSLCIECGLEPLQQPVDRVGELLEVVVSSVHSQAVVEVVFGDPAGSRRDRAQRCQDPPGHDPAEHGRDDAHNRQRDPGLHEQLMQINRVPVADRRVSRCRDVGRPTATALIAVARLTST
jgi:hypothetical protein